jgi:predicted TIM-barrel fold metal-dependent hydrolase
MRTITIEDHFTTEAVAQANAAVATGSVRREFPPGVLEKLRDLGDARIADLDAAGIDVQVISLQAPGVQLLDAATAVPLARETNDVLADAVRRRPDRLGGFATVPTADPEAAAAELERCVRDLGFKGAFVGGLSQGRFLDEQFFWPFLERAEALGVPIYLHPAPPPAQVAECYYGGLAPQVSGVLSTSGWGWHIETGLHALRLILAGVFDRFPRLQVVIGHLGEAIPFMQWRLDATLPPAVTGLQRSVSEYLRENVWFTTSGFFTYPPLLNLLLTVGVDRVIFSVDYPFASNAAGKAFLDSLELAQPDLEKIAHGNAERLLNV